MIEFSKAQKVISEAFKEWFEKHPPQRLRERVRSILDSRLETTVAQLLGFSNSWGKWEIDYCNGRYGESAAGDYIRKTAGEEVNKWLAEQAGNLPKLPAAAVKSLRAEYLRCVEASLRRSLREMADEKADKLAAEMLEQFLSEKDVAQ